MVTNKLTNEDRALFDRMKDEYQSENEREFFEKLRYKQEFALTFSNDLIMHERSNDEGLYIVRCIFAEYVVGQKEVIEEQHVMDLSEALAINLKETGLLDRDITLFEWLRERDYAGVEYDHNYDDM